MVWPEVPLPFVCAICSAAFRDRVSHIYLITKPFDVIELKPESLVPPHTRKRSHVGQRVSEAAQFLRRADQRPDLFRCRRRDLAGLQRRKFEPQRWIMER